MQKNAIEPLTYTTSKNQLKMDCQLKRGTWNCKISRRKHRGNLCDIDLSNDFLDMTPKAQAAEANTDKSNYVKLKSFCTIKETINRQKAAYRMEANIYNSYIW